jgi:hypothetical protein
MGLSDYLGKFWYSSEPMFGVIMVVCFTCILRYNQNPEKMYLFLDDIILAAISCCIAWGLVDGIFYAWEAHYEHDKRRKLISLASTPAGREAARSLINQNLNDTLVGELDDVEKEHIYRKRPGCLKPTYQIFLKNRDFHYLYGTTLTGQKSG